ncbi:MULTISPECIES: pyridoxamine 5'-phosphate oxidase family protein [Streptomyces]|uniref:Pyridoxamine 5'-phosphate oxidase family protein n=3 Tax=Streptomyces rochei group TaxID=2867164 RepID=A0AAX3ZT08_STRRO|nr:MULTISPECIES: TIGR03618 family F420-dependent PPOX class oxidoreductase [Streptomyces]MDV6287531.1 TIGR03618 family F420-dependent PPOX class oxidoreductase [Streptomyces sp. UP1A-1]WDI22236.1 TIGR03618 family F420-dependent PPOX class oxidoreductase [Streptomyces enissocaesilis]KYK15191.1 acyltransferase [Streptomyces sp. CC71]MBJ6622880.1 TIGR03618 family F420-dependent PPOX class oxidoreductase [Streptomyces sp. DHE17-7]MBU8553230.1 TIGR03618 family F420-dependent PPOX class oxidoreducta
MDTDRRPDDDAEFTAFWQERRVCFLSTPRADGTPHLVPVGVTYDHATRTARVITSRGTAKVRNVERAASPVVAVGQVDGRRWSTLEGVATVRYDAEAVRDAEARYAARYRRPRANPERVVVEIAVRRFLGTVRPGAGTAGA